MWPSSFVLRPRMNNASLPVSAQPDIPRRRRSRMNDASLPVSAQPDIPRREAVTSCCCAQRDVGEADPVKELAVEHRCRATAIFAHVPCSRVLAATPRWALASPRRAAASKEAVKREGRGFLVGWRCDRFASHSRTSAARWSCPPHCATLFYWVPADVFSQWKTSMAAHHFRYVGSF